MTSILEYEITELFESLEKDRLCLPSRDDCNNPATWLAIQVCCGYETPLCSGHYTSTVTWLGWHVTNNMTVKCSACGADELDPSTVIEWRSIK